MMSARGSSGLGRYIVAELAEERGRKRSRFERFAP